MASSSLHLSFLFFFFSSLLFSTHATIYLDPTDHIALLTIHKSLGITGQRQGLESNPCNSPGVFCERRISNESYVFRVTRIIFDSKKLAGILSPAIGKLSELKELSLPNNQLIDQVPAQIVECKNLEILNLHNNQFSGEVPSGISSLSRLRILDLCFNEFSGELDFLKYFPDMEKLDLCNNMFSGEVPISLRSFTNLRSFNISGNKLLQGQMPVMKGMELSSAPRRYRLAENSPRRGGNFAGAPRASLEAPAPAPAPSHVGNQKHKKSKSKKLKGWLIGFFAGVVAGALSGFVFSVLFKLIMGMIKGRRKDTGISIFSPTIKNLDFLDKEDGLASFEVIGQGGCGVVYKADLPEAYNKTLAIKKIIQPSKNASDLTDEDTKLLNKKMRQIKSEIQTVGTIRHRNILPLLGHVTRPDCHYLVYEFMKNGSLQDMLNQVSQGNRELEWPARHRIAIGVADGLEYLHNHSHRIIHRDLKPGNILLDDDMEARIADFGLAKELPSADTHASTTNLAGTVGYIAPEYHQTLKFTDRCDIFSFGVILGVLVMGKLPSDEFFQHTSEMSLVKWMRNVMTSDDPKRAIDPKLKGNGFEEEMLLVLKIACFCTLDNPKERPSGRDARVMLAQIKH
ncbi:leucine-rich repeat receptor-like serine/threonine/tyrosine-protein kinase SOBIR1 [Apium graveolens]|uniref:leucine-rich repeat receptor-like serine/threonine/tyrosine-protein kinase SOBIR1 n=1 Tax=Apium graveolens TaxID=4045 RepID=UPI003D7B52C1